MKAALVLSADSAAIRRQAGEINAALNRISAKFTSLELWLFYRDRPPEAFPAMERTWSHIRLLAVGETHSPEPYLQVLLRAMDRCPVDLLVFGSDGLGAELATRTACRVNGSSCLQVEACDLAAGKLEIRKPVYGNHLSARFVLEHAPYCLSVAKQACPPAEMTRAGLPQIESIASKQLPHDRAEAISTIPDPLPTGLEHADLVLVVGQGAGSRKTVDLLQGIADSIGAGLGASRPVVMNAWADMNRLIGTSGLILSPKLCIAAGVSGTGVFSVGINSSECIVAINTDRRAPIFQIADAGIVGDLVDVLTELAEVIRTERGRRGH